MSKQQAQELVENTLHNDFDKEKFVYFAKNLLNKIDETKIFKYTGAYIAEAFRPFVKSYERIGQYIDPENNKIDILIVYLQKEASLERARTAQRNFVARYLKDRGEKDAGLVAFVSPDPADWRFSLVKMEYKFTESKSGKAKVKEEFTPAKRWSFLVGKHEDSHTAQSRLAPVIDDDQNNPTLKQLEDAFNIEKVTKEFFEKYRELFLRVHETLNGVIERHPDIKADFTEKNVNTADFSKKLLGQIVFLYFLQKKGWFGVPMDKGWGEGDKKFLRTRFEEASGKDQNYFNDYLEPLFYEALAKERDGDFYSRFECKIPFLNGGLFDPINNYDWVNTTIDLPNELFSNRIKNQKTGDIGNGILDIFDRYNFTVKEDEPLEKEVAVDPEMLGKVFENLLEVKDRKSKGTYYTPREIVNYMCEQSLLNYLATELEGKVSKEDLEKLIKSGENVVEHEVVSVSKEDNPEYSGGYKRLLPDTIKESAKEIDEKLSTIKVCDPAIGSGAFPVGMMNAIVKTRDVINKSYLHDKNQTLYSFKRDCIQNSLYGVDIDPGAVEIAKLRLWLSLVVDEDDIKQIKPLPNLDYKIMQGNSLIEDLVIGDTVIKFNLDDLVKVDRRTKEMKNLFEEEKQVKLFKDKSEDIFDALKKLHSVYFEENNRNRKLILKQKIDEKEQSFISAKCGEEIQRLKTVKKNTQDEKKIKVAEQQIEAIQSTLQKLEKESSRPFFLWKLHFSEVFQENGGFDVVIGNPPYGFRNILTPEEKVYFRKVENIEFSSGDSAELFCKKSFDNLIKDGGILTFIIPKKSLYGDAWEGFRKEYWLKYNLKFLLDSSKAFQDVLLEANAFGLAKNNNSEGIKCAYLSKDDAIIEFASGSKGDIFLENFTAQIYKLLIPQMLWNKIQNNRTSEHLIEGKLGLAIGTDFFSDDETDYKLLKGIDIARWRVKSNRWLKNKSKLNWNAAKEFLKPKVIAQVLIAHIDNPIPHIKITACYDKEGIIITNTLMSFEMNDKLSQQFWLAYLNSTFVNWYAYNFIYARAIRTMHLYNFYIQQIPIPQKVLELSYQKNFVSLADKIQDFTQSTDYLVNVEKQANVRDLEQQIDEMVYRLYGLTEEEQEIIRKP